MHDFMTQATRLRLLARIRLLAEAGIVDHAPGAQPDAGEDAPLLRACARFADLEQAKLRLHDGPGRIREDDEREERTTPLLAGQTEALGLICGCPAISHAGLLAKAAIWQLWDGGELVQQAAWHGRLEDRLLVSLFQDLDAAAWSYAGTWVTP